ncbi:MAG: 16S rRNA processing protein RimM [Bacilli bacterium]|nr:16S rRNA processing protein RimM [Bacilli bacterium]
MKYVLIGKIVNTHGLKGEVRILSSFKYKDRVFKNGMKIYIGKDKISEVINSYRYHKIFDMITMNGYDNINQILKYKGEYVFINKEDLTLNENEYLDEDIIGLKVIVDNLEKGIVKRIDKHNKNEVLVIKNNNKDYLIPYNFDIIENINLEKKEMIVKNIIGLFD